MAKTSNPPIKFSERDLIIKGMYDPLWWMDQCGWKLWQKQVEICQALITHDRVAVPAAFGVGKTWVAARTALWWLNTHIPSIVVTTAPTGRQVRDLLWAEIRDGFHRSKVPLGGEVLTTDIRMDPKWPKWFATGFATNEEHMDKFTGYHSDNMLLIFDQACGIHKQIWTAGEGLLTSANCKWLCLSNTTDEKSEFAGICLPDRKSDYGHICDDPACPGCNKWKIIKIRAYDSPNVIAGANIFPGVITHDYVEKKKEVWHPGDPLWEIYIEANFVESGAMTVLHPNMVKEILHKNVVEPDMNNIVLGVDVVDHHMRFAVLRGEHPGLDRERRDAGEHVAAVGRRVDPGLVDQYLGKEEFEVDARPRRARPHVPGKGRPSGPPGNRRCRRGGRGPRPRASRPRPASPSPSAPGGARGRPGPGRHDLRRGPRLRLQRRRRPRHKILPRLRLHEDHGGRGGSYLQRR